MIIKLGITAHNNTEMAEVDGIQLVAGKGVVGDRHFNEFNDPYCQLTLIESENIDYYKGTSFFVLEMMPKYKNKLEFLNTLSHEMVHLWQQTVVKDTGSHNKLFFSFKTKFKKLNLTLSYYCLLYTSDAADE